MRADARSNRAAILQAARTLYATRGAAAPLSTIATAAGVGIATLYRHFPTQHDLELGLIGHVRDQVLHLCDEHLPTMSTDPATTWPQFAADLAALELGALIPHLTTVDPTHLPPDLTTTQARVFDAVDEVLTAAKHAGLVRQDVTVRQFHIGLGILSRPLPQPAQTILTGVQHWLLDTYLNGLAPR